MKKVIAFSLWGEDKKYTHGAIKNCDLAKDIFPDWVCRFYLGKSVPISIIEELRKRTNTELYILNESGDWTGMFWRFYAASDPSVLCMISRDCDSRLSVREKEAVDQWLQSDKNFHIMRDHPYHAIEILGGMWGCKSTILQDMVSLIENYKKKGNFWQVDQNFLKEVIYPKVKDDSLVHDEFFNKNPFPSPRKDLEFVGQVFDENENTPEEHIEPLRKALGIK